MTKNGQNMAKIEKIRKMQIIDNKEDKFFYFPMISMPYTGSGYEKRVKLQKLNSFLFSNQSFDTPLIFPSTRAGSPL